jgi:hypothetical protein
MSDAQNTPGAETLNPMVSAKADIGMLIVRILQSDRRPGPSAACTTACAWLGMCHLPCRSVVPDPPSAPRAGCPPLSPLHPFPLPPFPLTVLPPPHPCPLPPFPLPPFPLPVFPPPAPCPLPLSPLPPCPRATPTPFHVLKETTSGEQSADKMSRRQHAGTQACSGWQECGQSEDVCVCVAGGDSSTHGKYDVGRQ